MDDVDLATVAAFTAAGLSLINVVISGRLARQGQLDQWRRDTERPIVARVLTLSGDARRAWMSASLDRRIWIASLPARGTENTQARDAADSAWREGDAAFEKLRFESAQLSLGAGARVRDATLAMLVSHEALWMWLRPASPSEDHESWHRENNKVAALEDKLIEAVRTDIGVERKPRLLGKWQRRRAAVTTPGD